MRFGDTDALGHVNNAAYATYAEAARLAFFSAVSTEAAALMRSSPVPGPASHRPVVGVILARLAIDFRRQVRFGDEVFVETRVQRIGTTSITLHHQLYGGGALAADIEAVIVVFDYAAERPVPVPLAVRAGLESWR